MERRILIVDDEENVLKVLNKRLTDAGYFVIQANNGEEALVKAKSEHPDIILLDIIMPDLDGGEVAARLRDDPKTSDIPVIFLTCLFTKREEMEEGLTVGNNIFIAKPYNPKELLEEIKRLL